MRILSTPMIAALALVLAGALPSMSAHADKPEWAGRGKASQQPQEEGQTRSAARGDRSGRGFDDRQRAFIHDYYARQFRAGHCPPGLAKKNTGCMPPGQAKKWAIGQPLPSDVVYAELPPSVATRLGTPPAGHRYVRVASDILMITVGTSMVVDAIEDLGRQ